MIIVTGATGQLGSRIVDQLLSRIPGHELGVSVRDPAKASALSDRGVRVRAADFTSPSTLAHAFEGAEQVLVISAALHGDVATRANIAAIDAARASGARRILYTSHQAASPTSKFAPQLTHAATEAYLRQLDAPFVALRNGFYASTLGYYLGDAMQTGRLALPEDGPVSWTAHDDLAEVAAIALTSHGLLDGVTAPLTAPDMVTFSDVATMLSDITGTPIERVVMSDADWLSTAIERGMPAPAAEFTLGIFRAARDGEFAVTDPLLESIVGHPAQSVRSVLDAIAGTA